MATLLVGGAALAILIVFHPAEETPEVLATSAWAWLHLGFMVFLLPVLFGLTQLYQDLEEPLGMLGLASYLLLSVGIVGLCAVMLIEATIVPVLAAAPETAMLLAETGPLFGGAFGIVFIGIALCFTIGNIGLAIALVRSGTVPWAAALLLIPGGLPTFSPPLPMWLGQVGLVLWGAGIVWLSWAAMKRKAGAMG
jgi:hypothetical protein